MNILFIGIGNMGGAIVKSIFNSPLISSKVNIYIAKKSEKSFEKIKQYGEVKVFSKDLSDKMDMVFLGIKPFQMEAAILEHLEKVNTKQIFVSMAAGITLENLEKMLGKDKKIVRIMPNLPLLVGEGMTSLTPNKNITSDDIKLIKEILSSSSRCAEISEDKIDAFIGMSGSSPAFAFLFLEAMSDAGVKYGLTREETYYFASQALLGASKMVLNERKNPGSLKDSVCSPGGTTIEGVCSLEENGFRDSIIKATSAVIEKSKKMSKGNK